MTAHVIVCTCRGCAGAGTFRTADEALRHVSEVCTATADTRYAGRVAPARPRPRKLG